MLRRVCGGFAAGLRRIFSCCGGFAAEIIRSPTLRYAQSGLEKNTQSHPVGGLCCLRQAEAVLADTGKNLPVIFASSESKIPQAPSSFPTQKCATRARASVPTRAHSLRAVAPRRARAALLAAFAARPYVPFPAPSAFGAVAPAVVVIKGVDSILPWPLARGTDRAGHFVSVGHIDVGAGLSRLHN